MTQCIWRSFATILFALVTVASSAWPGRLGSGAESPSSSPAALKISPETQSALQAKIAAALRASQRGDVDDADRHYLAAIRIAEVSGSLEAQKEVMAMRLGFLSVAGGAADGLELGNRLVEMCKPGAGFPDTDHGLMLKYRGAMNDAMGNYQEAQKDYDLAVEVLSRALGRDNTTVLSARLSSINVFDTLGKFQESAAGVREFLADLSRVGVANQLMRPTALLLDASAQYGLGRRELALQRIQEAKALLDADASDSPVGRLGALHGLAYVYYLMDEVSLAEAAARDALELLDQGGENRTTQAIGALALLANLYARRGDLSGARDAMARLGPLMKRRQATRNPSMALSQEAAALLRMASGRKEEAKAMMEKAVSTLEGSLGTDHPLVKMARSRAEKYQ